MRRMTVFLLGVLLAVAGSLVAAPAQAAPYCGLRWGSLPEAAPYASPQPGIVGVRTGRHRCFDRLVVDLDEPATGWSVQYAPGTAISAGGSSAQDFVRGGAALLIRVDAQGLGEPRGYFPADWMRLADVSGYRTFRQVILSSSSADVVMGLGVRARLPFRVLVLDGPGGGSRLVIDVAHRW